MPLSHAAIVTGASKSNPVAPSIQVVAWPSVGWFNITNDGLIE